MKKVKKLKGTNQQLQNGHRVVKYSIRNMVNDIVITVYGARWVLEILGEHFVKYDFVAIIPYA